MEAIRGAALSSDRQSGCARFVALDPRNEPLARRSQHGGQLLHERAAALGRLGEAAGHARAKANTRRIARGEGRRRGGKGRGHSWVR